MNIISNPQDKFEFSKKELHDIICRAMIRALSLDNFKTPFEFTEMVVEEYYKKVEREFNELLNKEQESTS